VNQLKLPCLFNILKYP